jgi:SAM-dependent methyltransferase
MASDPRASALRDGYAPVADAYAAELTGELTGKPLDRAFLQAFAERVATGLVVDIGCGPGHIASFLASHGARVEGVDLSPAMIAAATARFPPIPFRTADMFALPFESGSIAGIVAFYAIVHLQTTELVAPFREFHRVLAPDGLAAVAFHAGHETVHVDELFGCATSLDFVFHRPDAVIEALTTAGFLIEARLDRKPYPNAEHASERTYLLARAQH